jgi:uncharacterized protein
LDTTTVLVLAVLCLATVVRSALGFGEALVAVPLLALAIPVEIAAPLAVLVSVTVAAVILLQDWRHVDFGGTWRLVASSLVGIPCGLYLLTHVPESTMKGLLGLVIVAFSLYRLTRHDQLVLPDDRFAWIFGVAAGVLGGAYGMNGPPLAVYGGLRRWTQERFRATLQGYFFPASLVGMIGYWWTGLWSAAVTKYYVLSLPIVLVAVFVGRVLNRRIEPRRFVISVDVCLLAIGGLLLAQSVWRFVQA